MALFETGDWLNDTGSDEERSQGMCVVVES
jgi:hypothetical protein